MTLGVVRTPVKEVLAEDGGKAKEEKNYEMWTVDPQGHCLQGRLAQQVMAME